MQTVKQLLGLAHVLHIFVENDKIVTQCNLKTPATFASVTGEKLLMLVGTPTKGLTRGMRKFYPLYTKYSGPKTILRCVKRLHVQCVFTEYTSILETCFYSIGLSNAPWPT